MCVRVHLCAVGHAALGAGRSLRDGHTSTHERCVLVAPSRRQQLPQQPRHLHTHTHTHTHTYTYTHTHTPHTIHIAHRQTHTRTHARTHAHARTHRHTASTSVAHAAQYEGFTERCNCVRVCACVEREKERERARGRGHGREKPLHKLKRPLRPA